MLLEGSNASTVLTWVRPDLDKHLNQIRTQIEAIAGSKHRGNGVKNTAENLTQLKYTFEALVLQGATLVVEEMITLCGELEHENVRNTEEAFGALMDAIVVVPSYLDRLQAGHHDLPILLLPVINELRAAYNANIVSEATLFAPDLDVPLPELERPVEHDPSFDEGFPAFMLRMRRRYENALLGWLQNQDNIELLAPIHAVCGTLCQRMEGMELRRLWWIASEVVGGIEDGVTDNDVNLRRLFARLHLTIKTLADGGEEATDAESVNSISQALLFHIAQAKSGNPGVDKLREHYQLVELVPDRDVLIRARGAVTGRNRELYTSLGAAVRDELSLVKDALDLELRTGEVEPERREESHEALLRLKDTLKMMGLGDSAQSIETLMPAFEASAKPDSDQGTNGQSRESLLMGLAGKLIQVESVLEEQIETLGEPLITEGDTGHIDLPLHEQQRIRAHLLDETVVSLHQIQDGVRRHFEGDAKADYISGLEHIAGAMELIGESETASLALKLRNALDNLLRTARSEAAVEPEKLEQVTDAVAAFELYLAGCRDHQSNRERFLEIIKQRLDHLPIGEMEVVESIAPKAEPQVTATATDSKVADTTAPAPLLDSELLDVFLEEYESVAAMLGEQMPLWMRQQDNSALMTDIRRGFHTLKGSGRMVGADELGDFSWHIEEMLNNLLDSNIDAIADVAVIVSLAEAALPAMKKRLMQQPSDLDSESIGAISKLADEISNGKTPDWTELDGVLPASLITLVPGSMQAKQPESTEEATSEEVPDELTLKELMCKELGENLVTLKGLMDSILKDRNANTGDEHILAVHTIAGTSALEPLSREAEVAKALEGFLEAQKQSQMAFNDTSIWTIATCLAHLETCLAIHSGDTDAELVEDEDSQIEQLLALTVEYEVPPEVVEEIKVDDEVVEEVEEIKVDDEVVEEQAAEATAEEPGPVETTEQVVEEEARAEESIAEESPASVVEETPASVEEAAPAIEADPVDTEILSIFLEEATEVLASCDSLLNTWRDNLPDLEIVKNLQREIHTFKGGARMSGVSSMGDLSHAMESLLERIAGQLLPPSVSAIDGTGHRGHHSTGW
jgi:chemosensory pili system protein ChpA (sensor histidine kinase/response regulator)